MSRFHAYAADAPHSALEPFTFDPGDRMLEFSARHSIAPITETFPMSRVNDALDHLRSGEARYRIVLTSDASSSF